MKRVERMLGRAIGLDPNTFGTEAFREVVASRMRHARARDLDDYVGKLIRNPDEVRALIEAIVVPETWFFREPAAFECLKEFIARRPLELQKSPVRVLSIPCATGEEPYSIAMSLLDSGLAPASFLIEAVDVSEPALAVARRGVYGKNSFRNGQTAPEAYFSRHSDGYAVREIVRECVTFSQGNVLDTTLFALRQFDVIFCKNLIIYLDRSARRVALESLRRLLRSDGILFGGHSESLEFMAAGFDRYKEPGAFAFTPKKPGVTVRESKAPASRRPSIPPRRTSRPAPRSKRPPAPSARPKAPAPAAPKDDFELARTLADRGETRAAREHCERWVARNATSSDGHCLLGILSKVEGDVERARESLQRAIYLDPENHEAMSHLALILEQTGSTDAAKQLRRRAERSLRRKSAS